MQTPPAASASTQSYTQMLCVLNSSQQKETAPYQTGHRVQASVGQRIHVSFRHTLPLTRRHHVLAFLSWVGHPALEEAIGAPQGCLSPFYYE